MPEDQIKNKEEWADIIIDDSESSKADGIPIFNPPLSFPNPNDILWCGILAPKLDFYLPPTVPLI